MTGFQDIANTLVDPKAYADGARVDDAFTRLRKEAPLVKLQADGFNPFWAVTKYADIQTIERDTKLFCSGERIVSLVDAATEKKSAENPIPIRTLVQMDPPDHTAYRRMTFDWFMPQNLRKLEGRIREIARELIDEMAEKGGECDFCKDVALIYPLRVIMEILGVPRDDELKMLRLTQELFSNGDPDFEREGSDSDAQEAHSAAILDMVNYFTAMTEDRRKNPTEDLATAIANGEVNGEPIGTLEAMGYYVIVASAGHDTTSATIAGALWELCNNPDELCKLKADESLISNFIEESVRWVSSVKHFMRTATADTEVNGQKIAKGDWLMLCYSSANRDEEQFDEPFQFKVDRENAKKNIAFGFGPHMCLGQHLSRLEMRVFWEELLPRLEAVELAGTPQRLESSFVCGPKSLPVRYKIS